MFEKLILMMTEFLNVYNNRSFFRDIVRIESLGQTVFFIKRIWIS